MKIPDELTKLLTDPDHDLTKVRDALDLIFQCREPDRIAAFIMPTLAAVALKVIESKYQISNDQLAPQEMMDCMMGGGLHYTPALAASSTDDEDAAVRLAEETAYSMMVSGVFLQMVASRISPELDLTDASQAFVDHAEQMAIESAMRN